jgi:hypothetical protein
MNQFGTLPGPKPITIAVPGGLAGQLFAVGYASWLASKRGVKVHMQFHDLGTSISKIGVQRILNSELAQELGITHSVTEENWPPRTRGSYFFPPRSMASKSKSRSILELCRAVSLGTYEAVQEKLSGGKFSFNLATATPISIDELMQAAPGSTISGFPTDYRVIEESWDQLAAMIAESGYPDFPHETGKDDTVAVHWRLGDYVGNPFHGAVAWTSLRNCLRYANKEQLPVKIFTDSPGLARDIIQESPEARNYALVRGDIWSDLFSMTRSRIFVGTQSGVSFLAALALRMNNPEASTWLPDTWFLNSQAQLLFNQAPKTAEGSAFYPARLVTSPVPR